MNDFDLINRKEVLEARPERLNSSVERITEKWTLADRSYARGWNACIELWARRIEKLPSVHAENTDSINRQAAIDALNGEITKGSKKHCGNVEAACRCGR